MENLGKKATDEITGFTGTITAVAIYISGETLYQITSNVDGNGAIHCDWLNENRVSIE